MISAIMSNYNGAEYLRQALDSVVQQNCSDFEFIVVDDGSTDDSVAIIQEYAKIYPGLIKTILKEKNEGQAAGFNDGFAVSQGELICFVDSDDIWYPNKISKLRQMYLENRGLKNAIYQHNLNRMQVDQITPSKFHWTLPTGDLFSATQSSGAIPYFIPTSGLAFPRWVLEKVMPISVEFRTCADGFLTRTTFCFGEVCSTNQCWGAYRIHGSNNTFQNPAWKGLEYSNNLLIPNLNRFYEENNIDLRFNKITLKTLGKTAVRKKNEPSPLSIIMRSQFRPHFVYYVCKPVGRALRAIFGASWVENVRRKLIGE